MVDIQRSGTNMKLPKPPREYALKPRTQQHAIAINTLKNKPGLVSGTLVRSWESPLHPYNK